MKHIFWSAVLIAAPLFAAHADDAQPPTEKVMPITQVYVPSDAKSNEPVQIVIEGTLPDSCYSFARAEVKDDETFVHEIRAIASVRHEGFCLMRIQNFSEHVSLGQLATGVHKLLIVKRDGSYSEVTLQVN